MKHILKLIKKSALKAVFRERLTIVNENKELAEEVVILTGAAGGIGRAIAEVLSKKGAKLVLTGRDKAKLEEIYKACDVNRTHIVVADITKEQDPERVVAESVKEFGKLTTLINCAGAFSFETLENTSDTDWDRVMNVNFKAMVHMCNAAIPEMKKRNQGCIVNIGSKVSHNTSMLPKRVLYATSKYAVEGFSYALRSELKPEGIRVCCLMPGTTYTYPSLDAGKLLSGYSIGAIISCILSQKEIDFESILITSIHQST